jgi:hypothetical protein
VNRVRRNCAFYAFTRHLSSQRSQCRHLTRQCSSQVDTFLSDFFITLNSWSLQNLLLSFVRQDFVSVQHLSSKSTRARGQTITRCADWSNSWSIVPMSNHATTPPLYGRHDPFRRRSYWSVASDCGKRTVCLAQRSSLLHKSCVSLYDFSSVK